MSKFLIIIFILLSFSLECAEDLLPSAERNIILTAEEGYGCIELNWHLKGLDNLELLELKILGRKGEDIETIDVTGLNNYLLDRNFGRDDIMKLQSIKFWLVATFPKTIDGIYVLKNEKDYIASEIIEMSPYDFPSPEEIFFQNGKIFCRMKIEEIELIKRFYGFKLDNKEFRCEFEPFGYYQINLNRNYKPKKMAALFWTKGKPSALQTSNFTDVLSTDKKLSDVIKQTADNDAVKIIAADLRRGITDSFDLICNDQLSPQHISISWNQIPNAEYYYIYRLPARDSLYMIYKTTRKATKTSARLRFDNNFHENSFFEISGLRSGYVYTYWINAANSEKDLGTSKKMPVYYINSSKASFSKELQIISLEMDRNTQYKKIVANHKGISRSLDTMGFQKHVEDFSAEADTLRFKSHYFEIKPYKLMLTGNDGYLTITEVLRNFLPSEYSADADFLALMLIINNISDLNNPVIKNSRIMIEDFIKIPIPFEMIGKYN